jgi:shikimate kinase
MLLAIQLLQAVDNIPKVLVVKEKTRIALIGFRASGKSLVGKLLAQELNFSYVDMDERLVAASGRSIDQWVQDQGWESFRKAESELLKELVREQGLIVATGGGVVLSADNRKLLKDHFLVIWLKASPETTYARMCGDPNTETNRPAFTSLPLREEIRKILAERARLYQETAHITLATDAALPEKLVSKVKDELSQRREAHSINVDRTKM